MIFFHRRRKVQRLAREYGMPEVDVRQMLAFERGATNGDRKDTRTTRKAVSGIAHRLLALAGLLGSLVQRR